MSKARALIGLWTLAIGLSLCGCGKSGGQDGQAEDGGPGTEAVDVQAEDSGPGTEAVDEVADLTEIEGVQLPKKSVKLDVLWVVDDSPSMCQEQQGLGASFSAFLELLKKYPVFDVQVAVTTTDVCPKDKPHVRGRFIYQPANEANLNPECVEKRVVPCLSDEDCQKNDALPDKEHWVCEHKEASNTYSCDKPEALGPDDHPGDLLFVINSQCRYACDREASPEACAQVFGSSPACADACAGGTFVASKCPDPANQQACANAGRSDWKCFEKCKTYLEDEARCQAVCSAKDCFGTCTYPGKMDNDFADKMFLGQDFLCALVCEDAYSCSDQCLAEFGNPAYRCLYPGGDKARSGCIAPPRTRHCPVDGPTVLTKGDPGCCVYEAGSQAFLDHCSTGVEDTSVTCKYFKLWKAGQWTSDPRWSAMPDAAVYDKVFEQLFTCMATVGTGVTQTPCANQEQGLEAAWLALDQNGENAEQAKAFHRPDAYLLIIVVSDEDDCSSLEGAVHPADYDDCACLTDQNGCKADGTCGLENGPLIPPEVYVERFKSLKADPSKVLFLAVSGDVVANSPTSPVKEGEEDKVRQRFYECKCPQEKTLYSPLTYVCLSNLGKADLGLRYKRLAQAFGPEHALFSNICDDRGLTPALEAMAQRVLALLPAQAGE